MDKVSRKNLTEWGLLGQVKKEEIIDSLIISNAKSFCLGGVEAFPCPEMGVKVTIEINPELYLINAILH